MNRRMATACALAMLMMAVSCGSSDAGPGATAGGDAGLARRRRARWDHRQ